MLKILQIRLQQDLNQELPDVHAGFRKGSGTRDRIANIRWIVEKAREFQKNIYFCFIDYMKAFVWITANYGKFLKRWEYQTILAVSWETCMWVKKQPLWNNGLIQNWKRSMTRLYIVTLFIQLICRVHHARCQARWITNCNQDCQKY